MDHQGNGGIAHRGHHIVQSLQHGVCNRRQAEEYDGQRSKLEHQCRLRIILGKIQKIQKRLGQNHEAYRAWNRDQHVESGY